MSAEGESKNFRASCTETEYDVIIFQFQVGGNCPRLPPPIRAPMARTAIPELTLIGHSCS